MKREEKANKIYSLKGDASVAKDRLMSIRDELEEIGAPKKDIERLSSIIWRLECWQNS